MDLLTYSKMILEKVSFDAGLFKKELQKSFSQLNLQQRKDLIRWCWRKYGQKYGSIITSYLVILSISR